VPPVVVAAGITAAGAIGGGLIASHGARSAANAQQDAAQAGIDEQRREYDQTRTDLLPWLNAGHTALGGMLDILGLNGGDKQQVAITGIQNSPEFASLNRVGTEAILQNASATGGLRGGNVQASLYNQRSDLLAQLIDQQFARLGGISGAGAGVGSNLGQLGQGSANAISQLLGNMGAARAGGALGSAQGLGMALNGVTNFFGSPGVISGIFGGGGGGVNFAPSAGLLGSGAGSLWSSGYSF
jgi:hypothetical protein